MNELEKDSRVEKLLQKHGEEMEELRVRLGAGAQVGRG